MLFTFEGIKQEFKDRLKLLSEWANTLFTGFYERIIDAVSFITKKLVYTAEFFYKEANFLTATKLQSVMPKVKFLSYQPHRKIGASGYLEISADSTFSSSYEYTGESVIIEKWTQFTEGNINVYCTEETIYYKGSIGPVDIPVSEGIVTDFVYIATGEINEIIPVISDSIDNDNIEVFLVDSNNDVIEQINICGTDDLERYLYFINDLDNYYCEIDNAYDFKSINIKFGDGVRNKKINAGDRILIRYGKTQGDDGNITASGVFNGTDIDLEDALGSSVTLYVRNIDEISNGNAVETIEEIQYNAPNLFQSGYRAGSKNDWEILINATAEVQKSKIWTNEDLGDLAQDEDVNKVFVAAVSTDGSDLTATQKNEVALILKELKSPTEVIEWQDLEIIFLLFKIDATVSNQPFGVIDAEVLDTLDDNYGILSVDFQQNIYSSNYINVIDDIDYIIHHETDCLYMEKNVNHTLLNYEVKASLTSGEAEDKIYIATDTTELWIHRKISGQWDDSILRVGYDSSGTILGDNGYTITDSDVNYTTNEVSYIVQDIVGDPVAFGIQNPGEGDDTGYILSLAYKTVDGNSEQLNNIRLPRREFITDIDEDYILTTYEYQ